MKPATDARLEECRVSVDVDLCIGCKACLPACPFESIEMIPPKDPLHLDDAQIIPHACTECGLCVTSCNYDAIRIDGKRQADFFAEIRERMDNYRNRGGQGKTAIFVFICHRSIDLADLLDAEMMRFKDVEDAVPMPVACIGVASVQMIRNALETGAAGVAIYGCQYFDCQFREALRIEGSLEYKYMQSVMKNDAMAKMVRITRISPFDRSIMEEGMKQFIKELKEGGKNGI